MIEIDGAYGEGGGQIVRTACALAACTNRPCHIMNIRRGRKVPGLRLQHVLAVQTLRDLCGGRVAGDHVGSQVLTFAPGAATAKDTSIEIGSAASIPLIAQCLIPYLVSASRPIRLTLTGGATDTTYAPPHDYFRGVFLRVLEKIGIDVKVETSRRGFYPVGGAQASIEVEPATVRPLNLTSRGALLEMRLLSVASTTLKAHQVAERQIEGAVRLMQTRKIAPKVTVEYVASLSPGSALCVIAEFERTILGASALGAPRKAAERVGLEAAEQFLTELDSHACLDSHMADQILPYMALAGEPSAVTVSKVTDHCRTNIWVIEQFIEGKFEVEEPCISWIPATCRAI